MRHPALHARLAVARAAGKGASTPVVMKPSGHVSVRSLAKYARVQWLAVLSANDQAGDASA
ncbi:hypothetical protein FNH04_22760 [Streptomyces phyllanthi]|uniref:Uncharacterized protein n=1 Tax=Streptomyces phyllanthi TaxID=1803180 RepID=A0A5N8W6U0_9ACTN|nr:hypothetical protein [Streptomyces phyllanthi]